MKKSTIQNRIRKNSGALIDIHTHTGIDPILFESGSIPYAQTGEDLVRRMDAGQIDFAATFPFVYSEYFEKHAYRKGVFRKDRKSTSSCPYAFENRRLLREIYDAVPALGNRLLPFAMFDPSRKSREQVEVLSELIAQYPLFGLKTASTYSQSPITDLLKGKQDLLAFAAEYDLPFMIHTAVMPADPWANVFEILKVVEATPKVRFCLAHTCRFDRRALDRAAELPNCWVDLSAFNIHMQLARRNHLAVAREHDRFKADYRDAAQSKVMLKLAETYPETILWGTDTPAHQWVSFVIDKNGEETWMQLTCLLTKEYKAFRKLPAKIRRRIAHDNSVRFLFG